MDVGKVGANGVRASGAFITKVAFEAIDRFTPPRCDQLISHVRILTSAGEPVHEPRRYDSLDEGPQAFAILPGETFALGNREEFHHDPKSVSAANGDFLFRQTTMMGPPGWKYVEYLAQGVRHVIFRITLGRHDADRIDRETDVLNVCREGGHLIANQPMGST
jgi:hypothetical protein